MSTASEPNNPAGRLHDLLTAAEEVGRRGSNQPLRQVWAEVLKPEDADEDLGRAQVLQGYAEIISLPAHVRKGIASIEGVNHERILAPLAKIEKAFTSNNLDGKWGNFWQRIDDTALYGLEVCDEYLRNHAPEPTISQAERERLRQQVEDLRSQVEAEESHVDLRAFIVEQLLRIEHALLEYRINGTPPLREAVATALGEAAIRNSGGKLPRGNRWVKKLGRVVAGLILLLKLGNEGMQLAERVFGSLPAETSVVETIKTNDDDVSP